MRQSRRSDSDSGICTWQARDLGQWRDHAGLTDECINLCLEVLTTDPKHFFALWYYSLCLDIKGDYEKAIKYFTICLNEESNNFLVWVGRGDVYHKSGDYQNALNDYLKAIVADPSRGLPYVGVANSYIVMSKFDKAHEYIDQAISRYMENKEDVKPWMIKKAQFFESQEKKDEALDQYKKALELFPDSECAKKKLIELSK